MPEQGANLLRCLHGREREERDLKNNKKKPLSAIIQSFPYTTFNHSSTIKLSLAPVSHPASLSNGRLPVYLVQDFYYC